MAFILTAGRVMLLPHASYAVICVALLVPAARAAAQEPSGAAVSGRVRLLDRGDRSAGDAGAAVVWLEGAGLRPAPARSVDVITERKEFRPRVTVSPAGSSVNFPNNDPFNHNVFSLSEHAPFDLGLYGRRQARSFTFTRPGLVRVFCNVHATMAAFVLVQPNGAFTQPGADGTFVLDDVPPGRYTLHAWHERATPASQDIEVGPGGVTGIALDLDARGYRFVQHLNKFGQPYSRGGARY
jgi:plastocyanin